MHGGTQNNVIQPASQESESFITLLNNSPFLSTAVTDPRTQSPLPQYTTYLKRKHHGRLSRTVTFSKNSLVSKMTRKKEK